MYPIVVSGGVRLGNHDSVKTAKSLLPPEACHQLAAGVTAIDHDGSTDIDPYGAHLYEGPAGRVKISVDYKVRRQS